MAVMREVGFWPNDSMVEDADLSPTIYCAGYRGVYLSDVRIFREDASGLEVWKKQAAGLGQGWAGYAIANGCKVLGCKELFIGRRIVLFSQLVGPVQGLTWVVVTFVSAFGLILGISAPSNSIFSSPIYIIIVTLPLVSFYASGIYALDIQKKLSLHNLILLPLLSYTSSCMTTAIMVGFLSGVRGKTGTFFRTPKYGLSPPRDKQYHRDIQLDRIADVEGTLASVAMASSVMVPLRGRWGMPLTLGGFEP